MNVNGQRRNGDGFLRKVGFTLAEILIALALIAVLAAVLLPAVAGQIMKGDSGRVMQDLDAVRTGIDQFLADVHRYPGKYTDLSTRVSAHVDSTHHVDINGARYSSGLAAKWSGPYVTKDTVNGGIETGFGARIANAFTKTANTNGIQYVTVTINGITAADFDRIDAQLDGTTSPGGRTTGLIRWGVGDITTYLATPIQ